MTNECNEPLWSDSQVAQFLNVHRATVKDWRMRGIGPPYVKLNARSGGAVRYKAQEVRDWLESKRRPGDD